MFSLKNRKLLVPFLIALIATILMAACLLLPFGSATDDHAEKLQKYPDTVLYSNLNMTAGDMVDMSIIEYAGIYNGLAQEIFGNASHGTIYVVFAALIGGFALLAALFTILRKPIGILIFSILSFVVFMLWSRDFTDRGVIPSSTYDWGIGYYLFYIATVAALFGAIWMLVCKHKTQPHCPSNN